MALDTTSTDVTTEPPVKPPAKVSTTVDATPDETPTVKVAMSPLEKLAADPSIPGELMSGTQKELGSIQGLSAGIRAAQTRAQKVLDDVLDNEAQGIQARGEGAINPQLDANKLREVYQPEQVQIILDKRRAYSNRFNATADWDENTPHSKLMADVEKLNPKNVPANSPAFQTYVEMYQGAHKRALEIEKERERVLKQTQEETGAQMNQMMLPDGLRPDNVPKITDDWLKANAIKLKDEDIQKAAKFLRGGAEYSDRRVRDDAITKALYMTPEEFDAWSLDAHGAQLLSNADLDHVRTVNKEAQDDVGVKFLKDAMDTNLLGKDPLMESTLGSLRQKVIQLYRAERSRHPEWKDSDRLDLAMKLERDNQIFDLSKIPQSLPITPYMQKAGARTRESVTPEIIQRAVELASADNDAGKMGAQQRVVEKNIILSWHNYFEQKEKNLRSNEEVKKRLERK